MFDMRLAEELGRVEMPRVRAIVLRFRTGVHMGIVELHAAREVVNRDVLVGFLEDRAAIGSQMREMAFVEPVTAAAHRLVDPPCPITEEESRIGIIPRRTNEPPDVGILRGKRRAKRTAVKHVADYDVAFHLHIARIGDCLYTIPVIFRVDVDLAPLGNLYRLCIGTTRDEGAAANADLSALGMEEIRPLLLDVHEPLDRDACIRALLLRHDGGRLIAGCRIANLDDMFRRVSVFDDEICRLAAAAFRIDGTRRILAAADADVYRSGILDSKAAAHEMNAPGTFRIAVRRRCERQLLPLHVNAATGAIKEDIAHCAVDGVRARRCLGMECSALGEGVVRGIVSKILPLPLLRLCCTGSPQLRDLILCVHGLRHGRRRRRIRLHAALTILLLENDLGRFQLC